MEEKLAKLFKFLINNRIYNKELHKRYYKSIILLEESKKDKLFTILIHIYNTQAFPNIDHIANFLRDINEDDECMKTMHKFIKKLYPNFTNNSNYRGLFAALRNKPGWGDKTAALFVKCIYHLHNGEYFIDKDSEKYKIWDDVPKKLDKEDEFYLPVDGVITFIFKNLNNNRNWYFDNINQEIKKYYKNVEIEIWDDLWFWGFITQEVKNKKRSLKWNENKYWATKETDKNEEIIKEIKTKAQRFLSLI